MISIGLITINFKNSKDTKNLLASVNKTNTSGILLRQYVIDNGSNDGGIDEIKKAFPKIICIRSKTNLGFAGGNNLGIKKAITEKCDYVLLINNDTLINERDFFTNMLKIKKDIVSPLVEYGRSNYPSFDYGGKIDYLFGRNTHYSSPPTTPPDYYSGVCLLINTKVFSKILDFDEKYFLYYEDADFCLRAKKMNFTFGFCPQASIFHHLSSTTNKLGKKKLVILANSHLKFCLSHLPIATFPFYFGYNLYLRLKTLI